MIDNYPPLSFYFVGIVAKIVGDAVIAGRIVALAAFVALAGGNRGLRAHDGREP